MKVTQLCLTVCDSMDYTVYGILQVRILEWVAFPFSRGSSQPRDQTQVSRIAGQILYQLSNKGSPRILEWVAYPFSIESSQPRNRTGVSFIAGRFFTNWAMRKALPPLSWLYNSFWIPAYFLLLYLVFISLCHNCLLFQLVVSSCAQISGDIFMA